LFNFKLLNETLLLDFIHRFHSRADLQLVIDFTQMPFHRIDGQKNRLRYFSIGTATA